MVLPLPQEHTPFHFPSQPATDSPPGGSPLSTPITGRLTTPGASQSTSSTSMTGFFTSWCPASSSTPVSTNPSRKRSRDESNVGAEDLYDKTVSTSDSSSALTTTPIVEEEPIYGEGMVLINSRTGLALPAESQTGTWYEEKVEMEGNTAPPLSSRSLQMQESTETSVPGSKSQRLDNSAPGLDDITLSSIRDRLQRSDTGDDHSRSLDKNNASATSTEPCVDDVTCLLGISWQRVSHEDDLAPAVCGWEKYIDNHYRNFQGARILLKNRSLNAYLVASQAVSAPSGVTSTEGTASRTHFLLFQEDLNEARLVSSSWEGCLQNLQSVPIVFEGATVLRAAERSPERLLSESGNSSNAISGDANPVRRVLQEDSVIASQKSELDDNMTMGTDMRMDLDL